MFKDFENVLRVYFTHKEKKKSFVNCKVQSGNEHQVSPVSCCPLQSEYVATQFQHHQRFI